MAGKGKAAESAELSVIRIEQGVVEFCVIGRSPLILNRVSEKAKRELLLPHGKKNAAEKAVTQKHNPPDEYRASVYRALEDDNPTRLVFPAGAFKDAIAAAALDLPGATKAAIGRLVSVEGWNVDLYGVPQIFMAIVRSADVARTPDVRTRAIVPQWACRVKIRYVKPALKEHTVANLFAAAGVTIGIGDFRQQKGKGSFGQFELCSSDDADFVRITREQGRAAQIAALRSPTPYDADTAELLTWYEGESKRFSDKIAA